MLDASKSSWLDVKVAIQKGAIAILAFGAHEQHGPHLPLSVDTVISSALAVRLAQALDAILLPAIPYGETWSTSRYPGTVTLSPAAVSMILVDIGLSLKQQGTPALVVVNGHFGNRVPLDLACRELAEKFAFPVLIVDFPGLEHLAAEVCESKPAGPGFYHADEVETSLMLAIQPDKVRMELARPEYPPFPATYGAEPWHLDAFCESGVFGDPTMATRKKGEVIFDGLLKESIALVKSFRSRHGIS